MPRDAVSFFLLVFTDIMLASALLITCHSTSYGAPRCPQQCRT